MQNDVDAQIFQLFLKLIRGDLSGILCDDDTADIQVDAAESVDQTQNIQIVGDAQVAADFILFNIGRVDDDDDFNGIPQFH